VKDKPLQISASEDKLTVAEVDLLETYFQPTGENTSRLSLIAFPHFQTFPSRVHKVKHSCGTMVFIDMMQHLQGLVPFTRDSKTSPQVLHTFLRLVLFCIKQDCSYHVIFLFTSGMSVFRE